MTHYGWNLSIAAASCPKERNKTPIRTLKSETMGEDCGEDSYTINETATHCILSIADGVGGWKKRGIDPAVFANNLMHQVSRKATQNDELSSKEIIKNAFECLIESYKAGEENPFGASTICVANFNKTTGCLDLASLGDSKVAIFRSNKMILQTPCLQAHFNTPLQLGLDPKGYPRGCPLKAYHREIQLQDDDIILIATDGFWDNLFTESIIDILRDGTIRNDSECDWDQKKLTLYLIESARQTSIKDDIKTPYSVQASKHGHFHKGGKKDDITLITAKAVSKQAPSRTE